MNEIEHGGLALRPLYGSLVEVCEQHGIRRTKAFELARKGLLETFCLGGKRYVYLDSVASLPARIGTPRPLAT